jgi:tetratricopeptide (TPR) repeat protein
VNRKPSITLLFILFIFFILNAEIHSQNNNTFPRLEPDPKVLEFFNLGRINSGYTWMELAEIALWASGETPGSSTSAINIERIKTAVADLNNSNDFPRAGRERAEFILTYMHRNILRRYSIYQTRVNTIFADGSFNCVSSSVLYIILCESAGIRTSGVVTKDHAFVMVHIDGQDIDVETTNRFGFDPGNRREFHDQFGRLTGFSYVPAQNYRDRQTISKIELVSLILNNRIAEHERRSNFAASVPIAIDRAALLLGESLTAAEAKTSQTLFAEPHKELMDRLFNYGASLLRANREEDCLLWATAASSLYPNEERWQEFTAMAINNRITRFLRENRITDARNFLENNKTFLTEASYAQFDAIVTDTSLLNRANRVSTAAEGNVIINDIENARDSGKLNERRASELITYTVQRTAAALCAASASGNPRDWRSAINYIEAAIVRFGANREWEQSLRTYRNNLAADYHNRFAAEWNRRNYDEAERILNEALAEFPDNRQLLNNRETVNRHRARN